MSNSRARMLTNIRRATARGRGAQSAIDPSQIRASFGRDSLIPERANVEGHDAIAAFRTRMIANGATVDMVAQPSDVAAGIFEYLDRLGILGPVRVAPSAELQALRWTGAERRIVHFGTATSDDAVGISQATAGIAETGTLMLASGPHMPTRLNFLPETHIVILNVSCIIGPLERAWERLRRETNGHMPRTVNLISGPSRTADIAMTMIMGAHGPKRLHVILVEADERAKAETVGNG